MSAQLQPATAAALFERCVRHDPFLPAVDDGGDLLTYGELDERANRLGRRLLAAGVGADDIVALAVPRSADLVIALVAVLKSGAAYLPLDLTYPAERLAFMIRDASPVLAVTTLSSSGKLAEVTQAVPRLELDDPATAMAVSRLAADDIADQERARPANPAHAAYVIYTSGSTGTPKGVVVTSTGMAALADTQRSTLHVGPGSRVLQWASISFDAAFWDISAALFSGATLVLAPDDRSVAGPGLEDLLRTGRITHATLPPAVLAELDDDLLAGATIVSTGDSCTEAVARRWAPGRRLLNGYGPTETTVGATMSEPYAGAGVPIGRPFTDAIVHVLDDALRPVGEGEVGEIYVGGPGVARGYHGRPALTAQRFVASPFEVGERLYRTGDLASVARDGQLVFRGRADDQVKIRGFRVEPGEVEAVIAGHPEVRQVAVAVREDAGLGKRLVAYVVTSGCSADDVRRHLERTVPDYLVPSAIVELPALPRTPNGKVDRQALPEPTRGRNAGRRALSTHERYLCSAVADLLGVDEVLPADDFFELGGHSLLAARLIGKIRKDLGLRLPVRTLYRSSRVADIATSLDAASPAAMSRAAGQENDTGKVL